MLNSPRNKRNLYFKRILRLKLNFYNKLKIIFSKRYKWQKYLKFYCTKRMKYAKQRFLIYDQSMSHVSRFNTPFKRTLKNIVFFKQQIKSFYGGLLKRYMHIKVRFFIRNRNLFYKRFKNVSTFFINIFTKRLDSFIYKANFFLTLFNAKQAINHKNVFVNHSVVQTSSYLLNNGDLVYMNVKIFPLIKKFVDCFLIWPITPKYCKIKYTTLEVFFIQSIDYSTNFSEIPQWLNFQSIVKLYR